MTNPAGVKVKDIQGLLVNPIEAKRNCNEYDAGKAQGSYETIEAQGQKTLRLNREKTAEFLYEKKFNYSVPWEQASESDELEFLEQTDALNLKLKELLEAE